MPSKFSPVLHFHLRKIVRELDDKLQMKQIGAVLKGREVDQRLANIILKTACKKKRFDLSALLKELKELGIDKSQFDVLWQSWLARRTLELRAIKKHEKKVVKVSKSSVLNLAIDAATQDDAKELALIEAVQKRDSTAVQKLLDEGANPNAFDATGCNVLSLAVMKEKEDIVTALLRAGAKVDLLNKDISETTIQRMSDYGRTNLMEILLQEFADPDGLCSSDGAARFSFYFGDKAEPGVVMPKESLVKETKEYRTYPNLETCQHETMGAASEARRAPFPETAATLSDDDEVSYSSSSQSL